MGICYFFLCLFSFLVNFSPVLYYLNTWNRLEKIKRWYLAYGGKILYHM